MPPADVGRVARQGHRQRHLAESGFAPRRSAAGRDAQDLRPAGQARRRLVARRVESFVGGGGQRGHEPLPRRREAAGVDPGGPIVARGIEVLDDGPEVASGCGGAERPRRAARLEEGADLGGRRRDQVRGGRTGDMGKDGDGGEGERPHPSGDRDG